MRAVLGVFNALAKVVVMTVTIIGILALLGVAVAVATGH
jgi:hypothetical protein